MPEMCTLGRYAQMYPVPHGTRKWVEEYYTQQAGPS